MYIQAADIKADQGGSRFEPRLEPAVQRPWAPWAPVAMALRGKKPSCRFEPPTAGSNILPLWTCNTNANSCDTNAAYLRDTCGDPKFKCLSHKFHILKWQLYPFHYQCWLPMYGRTSPWMLPFLASHRHSTLASTHHICECRSNVSWAAPGWASWASTDQVAKMTVQLMGK